MPGRESKIAASNKPASAFVTYQGQEIEMGSPEHHELMRLAMRAKLEQYPEVLQALLDSGDIRITHIVYRDDGTPEPDSRSIPGEVFSQIVMDLRDEFRRRLEEDQKQD